MKFAYLLLAFFTFTLSDNFSDGLNFYKSDANLSFAKFQSACDEKHFRACAMVGAMAYEGKGTAKNLNLAPEMVKFRRKFLFIVKFSNSVIIRPYYHMPLGHRKDINYKNASFLIAQI